MAFEKVVLDTVEEILGTDNLACFVYGSLSVICDERQARKIFHRLSKDYGVGKVQISQDGSYGYIFDFVA